MSFIVNHYCTSLILSFASEEYSQLEKFRHVSLEFRDILSHNPCRVWNKFFSQYGLDSAASIGSLNFISHNYHENWNLLKPFFPIYTAIKNGHVDFFKELQNIYKIPNEIILFIACRHGNLEIVKELVEIHNIDINVCFDPMHQSYESSFEYSDFKKYLDDEEFKKDISMYDDNYCYVKDVFHTSGTRPLHSACMSGNLDLVKYLHEHGSIDDHADNDEGSIGAPHFSLLYDNHFHIFNYLYLNGYHIEDYWDTHGFASKEAELYYCFFCDELNRDEKKYSFYECRTLYEKNRIYASELFDNMEEKLRNEIVISHEDPYFICRYKLGSIYEKYLLEEFEMLVEQDMAFFLCVAENFTICMGNKTLLWK